MIANVEVIHQSLSKLRYKVRIWVGSEESRKDLRS